MRQAEGGSLLVMEGAWVRHLDQTSLLEEGWGPKSQQLWDGRGDEACRVGGHGRGSRGQMCQMCEPSQAGNLCCQ